MDLAVEFILPGILLLIVGVGLRTVPRSLPPGGLPPAMIENGRPLPVEKPPSRRSRGGVALIVFGVILMVFGGCVAVLASAFADWPGMKSGRPLRVRGRTRLCRRKRGDGWHDDTRPSLARLGAWKRARLGERWLAAARAEHASIPAFDRLGAQLRTLGAPAVLVQRCQIAAMDEVRHARRCFALARAYAGIDWTAGRLPAGDVAPVDLSTLAVESVMDGCIGEGIAADLARASTERASDPVIRAALAMISVDEAAHAELAWDVVAFCISRGGPAVERALAGAVPGLRASAASGPIELDRATCRRIVRDRIAAVRGRLSALAPTGTTGTTGTP